MKPRTWIMSLTMLLPLLPLIALAQSAPPTPQCEHSCMVEYDERIDACFKLSDKERDACYEKAALAFKTCLAICH